MLDSYPTDGHEMGHCCLEFKMYLDILHVSCSKDKVIHLFSLDLSKIIELCSIVDLSDIDFQYISSGF